MLPEELARIKIDKQLQDSGWDIVSRMEYIPNTTSAVKDKSTGLVRAVVSEANSIGLFGKWKEVIF